MGYTKLLLGGVFLFCMLMMGCDSSTPTKPDIAQENLPPRDNTPICSIPTASGSIVLGNDFVEIDVSNTSEGYVMVKYLGTSPKVKFQLTGSDNVTYTYNLASNTYEAFPLSVGDGTYELGVYENIVDSQYSTIFSDSIDVTISNTYGPFLYANQYCNFNETSSSVAKGVSLSEKATSELDVVTYFYDYVVSTITYDYDKASNVASGYLPNPDDTLAASTGICLDYATLMTAMLRSQNIPTRLEVGFAGEIYHAWISVYIKNIGWVNGMIHFDGINWKIMDPTFAVSTSEKELKTFLDNESNYTVKYRY